MARRETCEIDHKSVGKKSLLILFAFASIVCCACRVASAGDFAPFVIPAKPNLSSPIAFTSIEPITVESERLRVDAGHFYRSGERVRLWGVNFSFGASLPKHEDAPFIAARLAAAGVNAVRCHHLDTARWPRGLWNPEDGKTIMPEALDRLDFFIDQLARHGIFVDINLHVGRAHSEYLGLPASNRQYDKISNIFTPVLVDAQKGYACELLAHVNPYRKVRYADDPAVAIVEITNENSFFMWSSDQTLRTLPPYYADILQKKFNAWLKDHYRSDEKLRDAWSKGVQPLGENLVTNADFKATAPGGKEPKCWQLEQHSGSEASLSAGRHRGRDGLRIAIDRTDQTQWHLQFEQNNLVLKEGEYYSVIFEAASDAPREVSCGVSQAHEPWANLGLSRNVELTPQWQEFRFGFVATADDGDARVSFAFGGNKVPIYLAKVELRPGGRVGLRKNESIKTASVALFGDSESPQRAIDRLCFLAETEKTYFDDMRNFVKNALNCKALVTGTIVFGPLGLYAQSDMDFIDTHAYWQHPRFPGRPWDAGNWIVNQKPMTDYPAEATLFRLAAERLRDKPFTVSEYNHPAPLDSQAECVPMLASFAAAQDWDGLWLYTYSHGSDEWYRENLYSYFDIDTNPAKWGFMRAGAAIFRSSGIEPLGRISFVPLTNSGDTLLSLASLYIKGDRDMLSLLSEHVENARDQMTKMQLIPTLDGTGGSKNLRSADTSIVWLVEDGKGVYAVRGRAALACTGHAGRFDQATEGRISISGPDFAAVTVTALDGAALAQSRKILVTACGRCENTGMKFSEDRQTVGRNWGEPPVRIETVRGTVILPEGQWKCDVLGPDGMPKEGFRVSRNDGKSVLGLSPEYKTMWYLVTR